MHRCLKISQPHGALRARSVAAPPFSLSRAHGSPAALAPLCAAFKASFPHPSLPVVHASFPPIPLVVPSYFSFPVFQTLHALRASCALGPALVFLFVETLSSDLFHSRGSPVVPLCPSLPPGPRASVRLRSYRFPRPVLSEIPGIHFDPRGDSRTTTMLLFSPRFSVQSPTRGRTPRRTPPPKSSVLPPLPLEGTRPNPR